MFSHKTTTSIKNFRFLFIALLMMATGSSYACSDTEYLDMVNSEIGQIGSVPRTEAYRISNFARKLSNISSHCAMNAQSDKSRQKMLKIKIYADSLERNADDLSRAVNKSMGNLGKMYQKENDGLETMALLFSTVNARSAGEAAEAAMLEDEKHISDILENW